MKDNLTKLLQAWDKQQQPDFAGKDEFKKNFFAAAAQASAAVPERKLVLWFAGTVTAAAAAIFLTFVLLNTLNIPDETGGRRRFLSEAQRLMRELKTIFPENNVGLSLVNGELRTFEENADSARNILLNYSVQRESDGKELRLAVAASNNNSSELSSGEARGSIWVYQPDSKLVAVDTDLALQLDAETTVRITESKLLEMNQKQLVSEFEYRGQKYRLFQTASRI